jgi:CBS domain-containing protein
MTIGRMCNRNVVCATRDTTVAEAANLMRHNHVGDVVVVDETDGRRTPLGIVTDRDIVVEVVAAGLDAKGIRLGDLAIARLSTVDENDSSAEVVRLMAAKGVRRLPVVDAAGALVGIVTIDDLLPQLVAQLAQISDLPVRAREHEREARR